MSLYADPTHVGYEPVNHEAAMRAIRALHLPEGNRSLILAEAVVRHCRTRGSAESYANEIASWLRFCIRNAIEPLEATPDDVDLYLATLSNYAMGTQNLKLLMARMFYDRAITRRWIDVNPVVIPHNVRRIPETDTPSLTKRQAEMLLGSIRADFHESRLALGAMRDFALITLVIRLALRISEAGSLRWGRVTESAGRRRIAFRGKGSKPAYLVLPDDVWVMLEHWKHAFEAKTGTTLGPADPVFVAVSNRDIAFAIRRSGTSPLATLSRSCLYAIVTRRMRDAGLTGARMSPHALRATGAVLAYEGHASMIEIKELLRHSSIETTMRYLQRLVGGASTGAIDKISLDIPSWTDDAMAKTDPPPRDLEEAG
jgi:integrase/recombinase XerD